MILTSIQTKACVLWYTIFWITLLISKLAFSYYVEILTLIGRTRTIMNISVSSYEWHEFFPNANHNIGVVTPIYEVLVMVKSVSLAATYDTLFHLNPLRNQGEKRWEN